MAVAIATYSKKQVNKAGKLCAGALRAVRAAQPDDLDELQGVLDAFNAEHGGWLGEAIEIIEWWRHQHARPLRVANVGLRYHSGQSVSQRLKRWSTIVDKLLRHPKMALSTMEDIAGLRVILPSQAEAYRVYRRVKKNWTIRRERDYVLDPKDDGYRALHLVVIKKGWPVEIQIRTERQDRWAQSAEALTRVLGRGLKFGEHVEIVSDYFRVLGELYALQDAGEPVDDALWAQQRELYARVVAYLRERGIPTEQEDTQ
jgi:hypothetical protein